MRNLKNYFLAIMGFLGMVLSSSAYAATETLTIQTYYPAPYGAYEQITTTGNAYLATSAGNVGIGGTSQDQGSYPGKLWIDLNDNGAGYKSYIHMERYSTHAYWDIAAANANDIAFLDENNPVVTFAHGGNVGIGTTNPGTYKCYISGTGYLNAAAWVYGSDIRLKENISYIQSGLNIIEQLKPVKFDYINGDKKQAGFIAQEVQGVLPDIVTEGTDGMLGMKIDSIIPYLVKAIQEQQKEIEALRAKLNAG